jgi:hypothetical protein
VRAESAALRERSVWRERAVLTVRALAHRRLYTGRRHLFGHRAPAAGGRRRYEHLWPFANAWAAVAAAHSLPGDAGRDPGLARELLLGFTDGAARYRRSGPGFESAVAPPLGCGGDRYFDDNAWLGLAAVRHYETTGDRRGLELAREAWYFVASGWSDEPEAVHPGGVRWKDAPSSRARHACSTVPGAQLGVLVHRHTGDDEALRWAVAAYEWTRAVLVAPSGLCYDRISPDGRVDRTLWSYNQGSLVGAGVLVYEATHEEHYLGQAVASASAALSHFGPELLARQGPAFNTVYFRNLLLLVDRGYRPELACDIRASAAGYAAAMWAGDRHERTGLFRGRSPLGLTAPMLEICALLAGAAPRP